MATAGEMNFCLSTAACESRLQEKGNNVSTTGPVVIPVRVLRVAAEGDRVSVCSNSRRQGTRIWCHERAR